MISRVNIAAARAHRDLLIRMGRPVPNGVSRVANAEPEQSAEDQQPPHDATTADDHMNGT